MEYIYAALLLHKLGKEVDENGIKSVVVAAGAEADDSKIKSLVASLKGVDIANELENASLAVASSGSSNAPAQEAVAEEKPKEEDKAPAAEGLSALFG